MIAIDFLVLTKNNIDELAFTLASLPSSDNLFNINLVVVDGSNVEAEDSFFIDFFVDRVITWQYFWVPHVKGIYPSMNFALNCVKSDWFIFLNSGDKLHPSFSISDFYDLFTSNAHVLFGQAEIVSINSAISWLVPDPNIKSISNWLAFFEPNHQAMFVKKHLSDLYPFQLDSPIGADASWKRQIVSAHPYAYIKCPVVVFNLGGVSSSYSSKILRIKLREPSRSFVSKLMELIKFFLFKVGLMSPLIQSIKSRMLGLLF